MEIQKNSRQIPSSKIYTGDKAYSDIMYGYLQAKSLKYPNETFRYLKKSDINFTQMGKDLKISRQTASKRFSNLMEKDLIHYEEDEKIYILNTLDKRLAALLPYKTVRVLSNTLKERTLSVLVYLLKTFIQHGEMPCEINFSVIKKHVGLTAENRGTNNQIIKDILLVLQKFGLIEYHIEKKRGEFGEGVKTIYILDRVDNTIILDEE